MLIDRDFFNKEPNLRKQKIHLTDNKEIYIRELTAADQVEINNESFIKDKDGNTINVDNQQYNLSMVARSVCDKEGKRLLEAEDLGKAKDHFSSADMTLLVNACIQINRLNEDIETIAGKS